MRFYDRLADVVVACLNVPELIQSYFPQWSPQTTLIVCPFHNDTNPSLSINVEGKAYCFSCKFKATNIIELIAKCEDIPYVKAREYLSSLIQPVFTEAEIDRFVYLLHNSDNGKQALSYLTDIRKLTLETINQFQLGYDPNSKRISLPVYNMHKICVNVRLLGWQETDRQMFGKARNIQKGIENFLFPEWLAKSEHCILFVAGEFDCLIGRQLGLPAVTWLCGENSWNNKYINFFKQKTIFVLYDNDEAGKQASSKLIKILTSFGVCTKEIQVPIGKDLSDVYRDNSLQSKQFIERLKTEIKNVPLPVRKEDICPFCGKTFC